VLQITLLKLDLHKMKDKQKPQTSALCSLCSTTNSWGRSQQQNPE